MKIQCDVASKLYCATRSKQISSSSCFLDSFQQMEAFSADFRVKGIPGQAFYVPNFISESDEQYLLSQINKTSKVKWTQLSNRRLQNWGGVPHPKVKIFG